MERQRRHPTKEAREKWQRNPWAEKDDAKKPDNHKETEDGTQAQA